MTVETVGAGEVDVGVDRGQKKAGFLPPGAKPRGCTGLGGSAGQKGGGGKVTPRGPRPALS